MRYETAPTSLAITIITSVVFVVTIGLLVASYWQIMILIPATVLTVMMLGCYVRAPVAYHVSRSGFVVEFRLGSKQFGRVLGCAAVEECSRMTLRLWGNGGLFAGTGTFWNKTWGIFRSYVTTSDRASLVLVETEKGKVLVSPKGQAEFINDIARWAKIS